MPEGGSKHPRDTFITVFGRKPVLEALRTRGLQIDKLLIAREAKGSIVEAIEDQARALGVQPRRVSTKDVTRVSRNARQDQGVALDVIAPRMEALSDYLARDRRPARENIFVLDGVTTPANVGMAIRSLTAAGMTGVVLPRQGCPEVGPLVVKASAGLAFRARILRTPDVVSALDALRDAGFVLHGLAADGEDGLYDTQFADRSVFVIGNETSGLSEAARVRIDRFVSIPLAPDVESLNAAVTAAVVAFELRRRDWKGRRPHTRD